jgi:interferon gamma-inducible protein 30
LIETCVINLYDWYTQALPFIICIESNTTNWNTTGSSCATKLGLSWSDINACTGSPKGNQFQYEIGKRTNELNPPHQYVPWIVTAGTHNAGAETAIENNMVKYICDNYKGTTKIAACSK